MSVDQSFISLFLHASVLVKFVMLLLLMASVSSWMLIFQRRRVFRQSFKACQSFEDGFWSGIDLTKLYDRLTAQRAEEQQGTQTLFLAGFREYLRLRQQPSMQANAIMEGVQRAMRVAASKEMDQLEKHLPWLATVGSVSPYVGLFGTVWGIMIALRALGNLQQATVAMVAPGISEALIATAMGLFAAIPAVMAYNRYANQLQTLGNRYVTFIDEFTAILHRQVHGRSVGGKIQEPSD